MRAVYIEWFDASEVGKHEWMLLADLDPKPVVGKTLGWILAEDDDYLTVAHTVMDGEHAAGVLTIPKGCIQKYVWPKVNK